MNFPLNTQYTKHVLALALVALGTLLLHFGSKEKLEVVTAWLRFCLVVIQLINL